jgi:hypothetical protein
MLFHATAEYAQGVSDVDPVAAPATILSDHVLWPKRNAPRDPTTLYLNLLGAGAETLTLSLYFLVESGKMDVTIGDYINTGTIWIPFATGQVITNGTLLKITSGIPAGGIIYGRRTADTITASQTRKLIMAWQ